MKKKIFTLLALFASVLGASAVNEVTVSSALVTKGKTGDIIIDLSNPGDAFCAFQMDLQLPTGITFVSATKGARFTAQSLGNAAQGGNVIRFTSVDTEGNDNYLKESGALFTVTVKDESGEDVGKKLAAQLLNMEFTRKDESAFKPDPVDFNIEIFGRIVLDENSASAPTGQTANVLVKRTIAANQWSTICLPFKMTNEQKIEVFGSDVEVANFNDIKIDGTSYTIDFKKRSATGVIPANTPLLIKTTKDITEFEVDGVTIVEEANPKKDYSVYDEDAEDNVLYATFYGTVKAGTVIPKDYVFLSGDKFYFSTGSTIIKGFRGYFWLKGFKGSSSAPEINLIVDGETTKVNGLNVIYDDGQYYNLKGQKIDNPTEKGVYIKNGKKVVIK